MSNIKRELLREKQHGVVESETVEIEGEGVPFPEVSRRERRRLRKNGKPVKAKPTPSEQSQAAPEHFEHDFSNSSLACQIEEGEMRQADPCGRPKGYCQCGRWRFGEETSDDEMFFHKHARSVGGLSLGLYLVTVYDKEGHSTHRFSHENVGEIRKFLATHGPVPIARVWLIEKNEFFVEEDEEPFSEEPRWYLNEVTEEFEDCLYSGLKAHRKLMVELKEQKRRNLEEIAEKKKR